MVTVRNRFHELGNWHNKISLAAIVTRETMNEKKLTQLSEAQLKKVTAKVIATLRKIEQYVIDADKTIEEIKPFIYAKIGPDTEISSQSK